MFLTIAIILSILGGLSITIYDNFIDVDGNGTDNSRNVLALSSRTECKRSSTQTYDDNEDDDDEETTICSTTSEKSTIPKKKNHQIITIIGWILCIALTVPIIVALVYVIKDHISEDEETNSSNITLEESAWKRIYSKIDYNNDNDTNNNSNNAMTSISISSTSANGIYAWNDHITSISIRINDNDNNNNEGDVKTITTFVTPYQIDNATYITLSPDGTCFVKVYKMNDPSGLLNIKKLSSDGIKWISTLDIYLNVSIQSISISNYCQYISLGILSSYSNTITGLVRTYELTQSTSYNLTQVGTDIISNKSGDDNFGNSICISSNGSTLAIGSSHSDNYANNNTIIKHSGQVLIYQYNENSTGASKMWEQINILHGNYENQYFGSSISLSYDGTVLAVGSQNVKEVGQCQVFQCTQDESKNTSWNPIGNAINLYDDSSIMQLSGNGNRLIAPHSNTSMMIIYEYNKTKKDWNVIGIINETSIAQRNDITTAIVSSVSSSYDGATIAFSTNYYHNYDDNATNNNNETMKSFIGIYECNNNDDSANVAADDI